MNCRTWIYGVLVIVAMVAPARAEKSGWVGRWDLTVGEPPAGYPSWLGITEEGGQLRGRFVWEGGGVTDPARFKVDGNKVEFDVYKIKWTGTLDGDHISGTCVDEKGAEKKWVGRQFVPKVDVGGTWKMKFVKAGHENVGDEINLVQKGDQITGELGQRKQPIKDAKLQGDVLSFSSGKGKYTVTVKGDWLEGEVAGEADAGRKISMKFIADRERKWGEPIELFNGKDLNGWKPRGEPSLWKVIDGVMSNTGHGANIVSERKFNDFKLHVEFRIPEHSNSGVYLRGRYEIQVEDNFGQPTAGNICGAIYTRIVPKVNASKKAGEWQTFDAVLVGQYLTLRHNGELTINHQEIEGITGGALDSDEGAPGPIYLQGDHGAVDYRKITITPAEQSEATGTIK